MCVAKKVVKSRHKMGFEWAAGPIYGLESWPWKITDQILAPRNHGTGENGPSSILFYKWRLP